MNLTFTSIVTQNGEDKKIEFTSPSKISKQGKFKVYEFKDPTSQVSNHIEVSPTEVNIFAGPSTINLVLNELVENRYQIGETTQIIQSFLSEINSEKGYVDFKYTLGMNGSEFGKYNIILKIQ